MTAFRLLLAASKNGLSELWVGVSQSGYLWQTCQLWWRWRLSFHSAATSFCHHYMLCGQKGTHNAKLPCWEVYGLNPVALGDPLEWHNRRECNISTSSFLDYFLNLCIPPTYSTHTSPFSIMHRCCNIKSRVGWVACDKCCNMSWFPSFFGAFRLSRGTQGKVDHDYFTWSFPKYQMNIEQQML